MYIIKRFIGTTFLLCICLQSIAQYTLLSMDENVRYGKLKNGLTYYIRSNHEPKKTAEFWIAQKVGSMQEEDNQRGLAHVLEHLAFNGSKNFPNNSMIDYLEKIGVKFGTNLNAYTTFDETVYNISDVPTKNVNVLDTCLLILHDWSGKLSLEQKSIDKEKKVITEEWRTRNTGSYRVFKSLIQQMYPNSKYAHRMPIGDMEVVKNFTRGELIDYYKTWYRPDLQGIVIVGDFDENRMERRLIEIFKDIPPKENVRKRIYEPVFNNKQPIVAIASDKETQSASVSIFYKHDVVQEAVRPTLTNFLMDYMKEALCYMFQSRLDELAHKPSPPFISASVRDGRYMVSPTKDAFCVSCSCRDSEILSAFQVLLQEVLRVREYGFTSSEYERARLDIMSAVENTYNERNKLSNKKFVSEYVDHFLNGGYLLGPEEEYELYNRVAPEVYVENINDFLKDLVGDQNVVISISAPNKSGLKIPTKEDVLSVYDLTEDWDIDPYEDVNTNKPLIAKKLKKGKIVKQSKVDGFGAECWTLSNGASVIWKKTDFKDDEILMSAVSQGGSSLIKDKDISEIKTFNGLMASGGWGDFSAIDLQKMLAGKRVTMSMELNTYTERIHASCSPIDLETMMQLVYLGFTSPKKDTGAYSSYLSRLKYSVENKEANPMTIYGDKLNQMLYHGSLRTSRIKPELLEGVNYDRIIQIHSERFKNPSEFTFVFVGNIDKNRLREMCEKYIASIPFNTQALTNETSNDLKLFPPKGVFSSTFKQKMETQMTTITSVYSGIIPCSVKNLLLSTMLENILTKVYRERIREKEKGTYHVSVSGSFESVPKMNKYKLLISFNTNPKLKAQLKSIIQKELKKLSDRGPLQEDFNKTKEYLLKKHKQDMKRNSFWLNAMSRYALYDVQEGIVNGNVLEELTTEDVRNFVSQLLSQNNLVELIMDPE